MISKTVYAIQHMDRFCTCNLKGYDSWHMHNNIVNQDFPWFITSVQCVDIVPEKTLVS